MSFPRHSIKSEFYDMKAEMQCLAIIGFSEAEEIYMQVTMAGFKGSMSMYREGKHKQKEIRT